MAVNVGFIGMMLSIQLNPNGATRNVQEIHFVES